MTEGQQLRAITASMIIDCHFGTFESISDSIDQITKQLTNVLDENKIEYELQDIQHSIIDSIALALRMKRGIKDWE